MMKLYLIGLVCVALVGAFFYGKSVGISKCEIQNFQSHINNIEQIKINERVINDVVYKTGVRDIRRILRDKYSIAE